MEESIDRFSLHPIAKKSGARIADASSGEIELKLSFTAAAEAESDTVRVVEAGAISGVILDGEKLQDAPLGKPEQAKVMGELNPLTCVTVMDIEAFFPFATDSVGEEAAMEKSGGNLIVYVALAIELFE